MSKPESIQEILDFFRIDASDLQALAGLRSSLEREADRFVNEFYNHLLRFPETQKFLRDPAVRDRLLAKQREYLVGLADPVIDADYLERRARIGSVHERIGLDMRWFMGAYALYSSLLVPLIRDAAGPDPVEVERVQAAMDKRLTFDMHLATRQYIERHQEELHRLNAELQAAGRDLTREVDETARNLRRTEARALAAEQLASVATLVSGLAHEVGTPMGVIRGHTEALEGAVEGERAKWRLHMIIDQIDRITSIIQSLLNIARPKQMMRVPLELPQIIESSVAFLSEKLRRRAVAVECRFEATPSVIGDPEKMQQVFLNLLINAIDAMPDGGTIGIAVRQVTDGEVVIAVTDSGPGIPEEQLATIFEPFYTTKAASHGNGLGLVVVQGIVGEHGGRIEARSESGQGTEFEIRLPAAGAPGAPEPSRGVA